MPTQYNGLSTNVSFPGPISIASSTFTTPIVLTTSSAHGLHVGDQVTISGHAVNVAANGTWVVQSASFGPTTFSISATGVAIGGATGTTQSLAYAPFAIPSDGDLDTASSVTTAFQALADRSAYAALECGAYKLVESVTTQTTGHFNALWSPTGWTGVTAATWTLDSAVLGAIVFAHNVQNGDVIEMTAVGAALSTVASNTSLGLLWAESDWGNSLSYAAWLPSQPTCPTQALTTTAVPFSLSAFFNNSSPHGQQFGFTLGAYSTMTCSLQLYGDLYMIGRIWRATQMPQ